MQVFSTQNIFCRSLWLLVSIGGYWHPLLASKRGEIVSILVVKNKIVTLRCAPVLQTALPHLLTFE